MKRVDSTDLDSVVIRKDKIYTSYYARACKIFPDSLLVSISLGIPTGFNGRIYRKLNPSQSLLSAYKSGRITETEYAEIYYNETLNKLDPFEVYNDLKGKVLLCYCGKDKFCHRHIVLEWLIDNLGEAINGGEV